MKIKIILKDPDGVYDAVLDAVKNDLAATTGIDDTERDELVSRRITKVSDQIGKWVKYGEYVTVELDTEAGTARVCEEGMYE